MHPKTRRLPRTLPLLALLLTVPGAALGQQGEARTPAADTAGEQTSTLRLDPAPPAPARRSRLLAAALSVGATTAGTVLGATLLPDRFSRDAGWGVLAATVVLAPSLGQYYLGHDAWGGMLSAGRLVGLGMVVWSLAYDPDDYGPGPVGEAGLATIGVLALVDLVTLASGPPWSWGGASSPTDRAPAPVAVAPWVAPGGGGGLALAGRLPW